MKLQLLLYFQYLSNVDIENTIYVYSQYKFNIFKAKMYLLLKFYANQFFLSTKYIFLNAILILNSNQIMNERIIKIYDYFSCPNHGNVLKHANVIIPYLD